MSNLQGLIEALRHTEFAERTLFDEPLARHTSFHVGGPADVLVEAQSSDELIYLWRLACEYEVPRRFIGGGTNILVSDRGIRGLVVLNRAAGFSMNEGTLYAESGTFLARLARWSARTGWRGLEWASGIPGTVGGAVVGNAGAYGGEIADVLSGVRWLRDDGQIEQALPQDLGYEYRNSVLKRSANCGVNWIVLDAVFELKPENPALLAEYIAGITQKRRERHPHGWSAGSVFKRTVQYPAGFLIEQAGLKGTRLGKAVVSEQHANYIINEGGATAQDIRTLLKLVQERVVEQFGEQLEPEIQLVGDWPNEDSGETGNG